MSWTVKTSVFLQTDFNVFPEISQYVSGASFDRRAFPGEMGTTTAEITIINNDGRFTPEGTGEFSNYDWFKGLVFITNTFEGVDDDGPFSFERQLFAGVVTSFDITEESVTTSTVTLTCQDVLSVTARSAAQPDNEGTLAFFSVNTAVLSLFNGNEQVGQEFEPAQAPKFYGDIAPLLAQEFPEDNVEQVFGPVTEGPNFGIGYNQLLGIQPKDILEGRIADHLNNTVLPTGPASVYTFENNNPTIDGDKVWLFFSIRNTRVFGFKKGVFTWPDLTLQQPQADGALPIQSFKRGFNIKTLLNTVQMTMANNTVSQTVIAQGSVDNHGERAVSYSKIGDGSLNAPDITTPEVTATRERLLRSKAGWWTKRFSNPRYTTTQISLSALACGAAAGANRTTAAGFSNLCRFPFLTLFIDSEPFGLIGSKVSMTPTDVRVSCEILSSYDLQTMIVGDDTLGVIGKMRLG